VARAGATSRRPPPFGVRSGLSLTLRRCVEPHTAGGDRTVATALAALPEAQREVISLRFIAGLPTRQVAYVTDRSEKAVESLQHRALDALRRGMALEGVRP
jgi:DNA-directed RNA polymerase specialized sigma24 family protein